MDNEIEHMHPALRDIVYKFITRCHENGYTVKITEGYRNKKSQELLYSQGRINDLEIATSICYPYSMHNWGLAFTICRNDGLGYFNNHGFWFEQVGKIGLDLGLTWNKDKKEYFQLNLYGDNTNTLIRKYGSPERFISLWGKNPNSTYHYTKKNLKFKKPSPIWIMSVQSILNLKREPNGLNDTLEHSIEINMCKNYNHPLIGRMQKRLVELGYYDSGKEISGIYDAYTKECVIKVQKDIGLLRCDGIIRRKDDVWKVLLGIIQK